jgi:hypothetical protein
MIQIIRNWALYKIPSIAGGDITKKPVRAHMDELPLSLNFGYYGEEMRDPDRRPEREIYFGGKYLETSCPTSSIIKLTRESIH